MNAAAINIFFLAVFILYLSRIKRKGTKLRYSAQKSFEELDYYLKMRWELIPLLLETAGDELKNTQNNEQPLLLKIKELVKYDYSTLTKTEKLRLNGRLTTGLEKLFCACSKFEQFKNNGEFLALKNKIEEADNRIIKMKNRYNSSVKEYNKYLQTLPHCIFTLMFGFECEEIFENFSDKLKHDKIDE